MPIDENGIGTGDYTELKFQHLEKILEMHLAITRSVMNKNRSRFYQTYRYIDATAGCGMYIDGMLGSPIRFLERAERFKINYRADFIEQNPININKLKELIESKATHEGWQIANLHYHDDCYQAVLPTLLVSRDFRELGLLFVDPTGSLPHFDIIALTAKQRPRMDILLYISTTNVKRLYQTTHTLLRII